MYFLGSHFLKLKFWGVHCCSMETHLWTLHLSSATSLLVLVIVKTCFYIYVWGCLPACMSVTGFLVLMGVFLYLGKSLGLSLICKVENVRWRLTYRVPFLTSSYQSYSQNMKPHPPKVWQLEETCTTFVLYSPCKIICKPISCFLYILSLVNPCTYFRIKQAFPKSSCHVFLLGFILCVCVSASECCVCVQLPSRGQ